MAIDNGDYEPNKMDATLKAHVENMSGFQRKYCEARSKGLKQADAVYKAGSNASSRANAGRIGYNTEQLDGVKEYISFLMEKRATLALVDSIEIVEKVRAVYDEAMEAGKFGEANKAAEMLGNMIGLFDKNKQQQTETSSSSSKNNKGPKNNINAFKDEDDSPDEKIHKLRSLLKEEKGKG